MRFYAKEIETSIKLEDGHWFNAKSNLGFIVEFEARSYGIKDTYIYIDSLRACWIDENDDDEIDYELIYEISGLRLRKDGKIIRVYDDITKFEKITNLDTTGSGMIAMDNIVIDLANKTIELTL